MMMERVARGQGVLYLASMQLIKERKEKKMCFYKIRFVYWVITIGHARQIWDLWSQFQCQIYKNQIKMVRNLNGSQEWVVCIDNMKPFARLSFWRRGIVVSTSTHPLGKWKHSELLSNLEIIIFRQLLIVYENGIRDPRIRVWCL